MNISNQLIYSLLFCVKNTNSKCGLQVWSTILIWFDLSITCLICWLGSPNKTKMSLLFIFYCLLKKHRRSLSRKDPEQYIILNKHTWLNKNINNLGKCYSPCLYMLHTRVKDSSVDPCAFVLADQLYKVNV